MQRLVATWCEEVVEAEWYQERVEEETWDGGGEVPVPRRCTPSICSDAILGEDVADESDEFRPYGAMEEIWEWSWPPEVAVDANC